jgi:hypothetical protein
VEWATTMAGTREHPSDDNGDAVGLLSERIVALLRPGRGPDSEWLDDDRLEPGRGKPGEELPVAEGRAEEIGDQHDRVSPSRHRHLERFGGREMHVELADRVPVRQYLRLPRLWMRREQRDREQ